MPDSTLANLTAATAATGGLFYGTQAGVDKKFTSTAAGAALIEAADAAAQRSLLSVLPLSGGTLTGTLTGTTFVGALTGTASGNLVAGGALGTPSSGTLTSCTGLPLSTGVTGTLPIANGGTGSTTAAAARVALGVSEIIAAVAQVIVVSVQNSATNSWAGEYVDIDDGTEVCRFWFTVDGSGTAPSAPSPGRLQVVAVSDGSSPTDVEAAFIIALSSQSAAFSAIPSYSGSFTVTNLTAGAAPGNGSSLPTDFSFNTSTAGADAISRLAEADGSQLTNINAATIPGPLTTNLGGVYSSSGSTGQFVTGVATSGDLIYSALPTTAIANGGTGQTTAVAAFDALAPTTTKGDLIVHNGTDNIRVAVGGTNGHVLTVDSAEASGVKWAAASGGGGSGAMVLLASATASSSADITFDNEFDSSLYSEYVLKFQGVQPATDGTFFRVQLRNSTPATITDVHRNCVLYARIDATAALFTAANQGGSTGWEFAQLGNASNELNSGTFYIQPISGQWTHMNFQMYSTNNNTQRYRIDGAGACEGTTAPAGVKIYMSSGNISRGAFQLYGITK